MNKLAKNIIPIKNNFEANLEKGIVLSGKNEDFIVDLSGKKSNAKKTFSCLIEPEINDVVLCIKDTENKVYILSILKRPENKKTNISFASDTQITCQLGNLNITSNENLSFASKDIGIISKSIVHKSSEAIISYENITASGNEINAAYKTVRLISELINTMAKQVIDKFKGYIRNTEENDMVNCGQMTRKAKGLYCLDSDHTIMNSKKTTKIDGDKILMG
jgi:hypothetical protein